jgi:hypothetical protein
LKLPSRYDVFVAGSPYLFEDLYHNNNRSGNMKKLGQL